MEKEKEIPFFSVVVLAYQVAPFIEKCLRSILYQSFQNIEVIIVNPAGKDQTGRICEDFAVRDRRIRLIQMENRGQLLNRQEGFLAAKGRYLLCIDGDDWWKTDTLQELYDSIRKEPCDLIIFGYEAISNGQIVYQQLQAFPDGSVYEENEKKVVYEKLIQGEKINSICTKAMANKLFQRLTEDFSGYSSMRYGEDLLYSLYIADAAERILYLDKALYCYRKRENSTVRVFSYRELEDHRILFKHILKLMKKWEMTDTAYYEMFYNSAAVFFRRIVFRCSTSDLPIAEKKACYNEIRNDPLYIKTKKYQKRDAGYWKERLFLRLFYKGDILVLFCGNVYRIGKRWKNVYKHIKEGFKNGI